MYNKMVRTYRNWSQEDMKAAIDAVKIGKLSQRAAAGVYGIPRRTLDCYIKSISSSTIRDFSTRKASYGNGRLQVYHSQRPRTQNPVAVRHAEEISLQCKNLHHRQLHYKNKDSEVNPKRVVISDCYRHEDDDYHEKKEKNDDSEDKSQITKESDGSSNCSSQLYGKSSGEPMILLKDGIYCTKKSFDDAVDFSRKSATSFLRRIADGVFKPVAIQNCTYSGRPPNAQGPERQSAKVEALDRNAKKAIIEFCEEYALKVGWPRASPSKMRRAMSQWIGEKKRKKNIEYKI